LRAVAGLLSRAAALYVEGPGARYRAGRRQLAHGDTRASRRQVRAIHHLWLGRAGRADLHVAQGAGSTAAESLSGAATGSAQHALAPGIIQAHAAGHPRAVARSVGAHLAIG